MRTRFWCIALVLAALGVACGDQPTEVVVDQEAVRGAGMAQTPGMTADATATSDDGLVITTDKDDYQPGDTVYFSGSGWAANDVLDIVLTDDPLTHDPHRWTVDVDESGTFRDSTYVVDEGDLNVTFTLVATSRATERSLTVVFTDNIPPGSVTVLLNNAASVTVAPGATIALAVTARVSLQGGQNAPLSWQSTGWVLLPSPANTEPTGKLANCVNTPNVPGTSGQGTQATATFNITAPAAAGAYDLWVALSDVDGTGATACGGGGLSQKVQFATRVTVQVVDGTAPTVTINQAAGQADPTNASPINFTVVFSEDGNRLHCQRRDALPGLRSAATTCDGNRRARQLQRGRQRYDRQTATVVASIPAGAATDAAGNGNTASTSDRQHSHLRRYRPDGHDQPGVRPGGPNQHFADQLHRRLQRIGDRFRRRRRDHCRDSGATSTRDRDRRRDDVQRGRHRMTTDGTVIATIGAGVATDAAGNQNAASSSDRQPDHVRHDRADRHHQPGGHAGRPDQRLAGQLHGRVQRAGDRLHGERRRGHRDGRRTSTSPSFLAPARRTTSPSPA